MVGAVVDAWSRRGVPNTALNVSGLALVFVAAGVLASALVEVVDGGEEVGSLLASAATIAVLGLALWRFTRIPRRVGARSAFAAVAWTWIIVSLAGAIPFLFAGIFEHADDALFESIAGFTGTGSTVLAPIEGNSAGVLFWRQLTQWYGGMGMVVLAVAVLPFLGVGGLELIRAEAPGPETGRLTPRVSETAKRLWYVYVGITAAVALALLAVGLSPYDAVAHALTAVPTGGFSPYDTSIGHFGSVAVEAVLLVAMVAGGTNFVLHWRAFHGRPSAYWRMPELRVFLGVLAAGVVLVTALNVLDGVAMGRALRESAFSVVSIGTTTGYATADFATWVPAAQLLLLALMVSGAMTGSTSGAVKLFRFQILGKYAARETHRARHPRGVFMVRFGEQGVAERVVELAVGFVILYVGILLLGALVLTGLGADLVTALSGSAAAMGCIGPGLGEVGPASNFLAFSRPARAVLDVLMLLGRLEIFPMLLMFSAMARTRARRLGRRARPELGSGAAGGGSAPRVGG